MAEIVTGVACSHSPMLNSGAKVWREHADRDARAAALVATDGRVLSFDELLDETRVDYTPELTDEVFSRKFAAMQDGLAACREHLQASGATVAIIIGNDHKETFSDEGMPTFAVYLGDSIIDVPNSAEVVAAMSPDLRVGQWAYHAEEPEVYPVAAGLARHITASLVADDFDLTAMTAQPAGRLLGHAWTFPRRRLMGETPMAMVPIHLNTLYPPNQPSPERCLHFGRALASAIRSWPGGERVAIITSGGLSHFVVDEELDHQVLRALQARDAATIEKLPVHRLQGGNSEILNWIVAAGALGDLDMKVLNYIPGYRSTAGTGVGVAYAVWGPEGRETDSELNAVDVAASGR
jgi:3-O-methylgallate 3,4-dioxygenase